MAELKPTLNSPLRKIFGPLTDGTARFLIKNIPGIKADHITYAGLGLTVVGSIASLILPEKKVSKLKASLISLALMLFGVGFDAIDGAVARNSKKPKDYHELDGMLTDVVHNRIGETVMALARIIASGLRKDPIGAGLATMAGVTSPYPSVARAESEALGVKVPELGKNPPTAKLGTRVPRAIFAIVGTAFPVVKIKGNTIHVQRITDSLTLIGNVSSLAERRGVLKKVRRGEIKKNLGEKDEYYGSERAKRLRPYSTINALVLLGSAAALFIISNQKSKK